MVDINTFGEVEEAITKESIKEEQLNEQSGKINEWINERIENIFLQRGYIGNLDQRHVPGTKKGLEELGVCSICEMEDNDDWVLFTFQAEEIPGDLILFYPGEESSYCTLESWIDRIDSKKIKKVIKSRQSPDMDKLTRKISKKMEAELRGKATNLDQEDPYLYMYVIENHGLPGAISFSLPIKLPAAGRIRNILYQV